MNETKKTNTGLLVSYIVLLSLDIVYVTFVSITEFNISAELQMRSGEAGAGYLNSIFGALFMGLAIIGAWQWFISLELVIGLGRLGKGVEVELSPNLQKRQMSFSQVRLIMANIVSGLVLLSALVIFFIALIPMSSTMQPVLPSSAIQEIHP